MKRTKRFTYSPKLSIAGTGTDLVLAYDSACALDRARQPRLIRIPPFRALSMRCSDLTVNGDGERVGVIELVLDADDGKVETRHVAGVQLPSGLADVQETVSKGVRDAAAQAIEDYTAGTFHTNLPAGAQPAQRARQAAPGQSPWKTAGVALAGVLVAFVAIAAIRSRQPVAGPPETLAARTLLADPNTVQAQIDLNNQVLRSMGLDPGAAADMGCLAAPPTATHE